jgi:N-formylglutamate amidohydrolase
VAESGQPDFFVREPSVAGIPVVVSIPHTGVQVPRDISEQFASEYIASLPMTDWHLHHLYDFLPGLGVTTIFANWSRFVVDLNRSPVPLKLYPGRFETGLVANETFKGEPIWKSVPDAAVVEQRRLQYHRPYHERLSRLLASAVERSGQAWLIDAHSVVTDANRLHGALQKEIYLGDREGRSCEAPLMDFFAGAFGQAELSVSRNDPYKGGYITAHYGQSKPVQALQIEMCQRVYMNEEAPETALSQPKFIAIKKLLTDIFSEFSAMVRQQLTT